MTEGGNHGGPSDLETHVPIAICPTFAIHTTSDKIVKPGFLRAFLNACMSLAANIEQVDLVPTLATILQAPVPVNNIGVSFYNLITSEPIDGIYSLLANALQFQNLLLGIKADLDLSKAYLLCNSFRSDSKLHSRFKTSGSKP